MRAQPPSERPFFQRNLLAEISTIHRSVAETSKPRWRETGETAGKPAPIGSRYEMLPLALFPFDGGGSREAEITR